MEPIMYLVVRRQLLPDETTLVTSAARAATRCIEYKQNEYLDEWLGGVYAKVVLQANEADWKKLEALPRTGDEYVRALPPIPRDKRENFLRRLRLFQPPRLEVGSPSTPDWGLPLVINTSLEMSLGKTMAQVAHATCLSHLKRGDPRWLKDMPIGIYETDDWEGLKESADVLVYDAGRTELAPGSETVLALPLQDLDMDLTPWRGTTR